MMDSLHSTPILIFDGLCNLCNGLVQFIIQRDHKGIFRFASLQSENGKKLLAQYGLPIDTIDTLVLIENNEAYIRSTAALKIAPYLSGFWIWTKLLWLFPTFIRDWGYDFIARYRYRWFGKRERCMLPREEWRERFL